MARNGKRKRRQATPEQRAAAAERRERLRGLVERVAAMSEAERQKIIAQVGAVTSCTGRTLSAFNTVFVLTQLETASMVGGFRQWKTVGRRVAKGAKALAIWVPKVKDEKVDDGEEARVRFFLGNVFDISQTVELEDAP